MLCKIALGWFFLWRKSGTVVAVGVPDVFFALCKKCDRKKQQQGGCAEAGIKTVQAPLRQAQRPLGKLRWRLGAGIYFRLGKKAFVGAARN